MVGKIIMAVIIIIFAALLITNIVIKNEEKQNLRDELSAEIWKAEHYKEALIECRNKESSFRGGNSDD